MSTKAQRRIAGVAGMAESPNTSPRLDELRQRWEDNPDSRVFLQLAEEYRRLGRLQDAAAALEEGLERRPNDAAAMVALSRCRLDLDEVGSAIELLDGVLAIDPAHIVANKLLVDGHLRLGDADKARDRLAFYRLLNDRDPELDHFEYRLSRLAAGAKEPGSDLLSVADSDSEPETEPIILPVTDEIAVEAASEVAAVDEAVDEAPEQDVELPNEQAPPMPTAALTEAASPEGSPAETASDLASHAEHEPFGKLPVAAAALPHVVLDDGPFDLSRLLLPASVAPAAVVEAEVAPTGEDTAETAAGQDATDSVPDLPSDASPSAPEEPPVAEDEASSGAGWAAGAALAGAALAGVAGAAGVATAGASESTAESSPSDLALADAGQSEEVAEGEHELATIDETGLGVSADDQLAPAAESTDESSDRPTAEAVSTEIEFESADAAAAPAVLEEPPEHALPVPEVGNDFEAETRDAVVADAADAGEAEVQSSDSSMAAFEEVAEPEDPAAIEPSQGEEIGDEVAASEVPATVAMAEIYEQQGYRDEAKQVLHRILEADPANLEARALIDRIQGTEEAASPEESEPTPEHATGPDGDVMELDSEAETAELPPIASDDDAAADDAPDQKEAPRSLVVADLLVGAPPTGTTARKTHMLERYLERIRSGRARVEQDHVQ